jgi:transcriptional regulator with XRE-family HTH domain
MAKRIVVGERLRALRGEKSREEVAMAIGVTAQAICNYECSVRMPSDDVKMKLASYFGKSVQEIFFD